MQAPPTKSPDDPESSTSTPKDKSLADTIEQEVKTTPAESKESPTLEKSEVATSSKEELEKESSKDGQKDKQSLSPLEDRGKAIEITAKDPTERVRQLDPSTTTSSPPLPRSETTSESQSQQSSPSEKPDSTATATHPPTATLSTVMAMPAPSVEKPEEQKLPHMQAPPYVHHFDTYTLVRDLQKGEFSPKQSELVMKGVRSLLGVNMDLARESLVSKSDVENETYLFRAACSELRTEILNLRRSTTSKQKSQLSHLQHTFDILSQRTTAELASLRDDLKGMLNDRRMDNRQNSQSLDSSIAEINYKIGVRLGGDAKSGVEGLRWVMTRRSAMAFGATVLMIVGALWYGSVVVHERERKEKEKRRAEKEMGRTTSAGQFVPQTREMGTRTDGPEQKADKKDGSVTDVAYSSLG